MIDTIEMPIFEGMNETDAAKAKTLFFPARIVSTIPVHNGESL
jgi:hypothetical protein